MDRKTAVRTRAGMSLSMIDTWKNMIGRESVGQAGIGERSGLDVKRKL